MTESEIPREAKSGKPLILRPGKTKPEPYLRASSAYKLIEDAYGLTMWKINRVGYMVATDERLREEWAKLDPDDKSNFWPLKDLQDKTLNRWRGQTGGGGTKAAARGTRFHAITDKSDTLDVFDVPEEWADDLQIYNEALERAGISIIASERFVVDDELGFGGTLDKLLHTDLLTPDGEPAGNVVGDLKTGKIKDKDLEFGMQMAVYANSVFYSAADGSRTPLPNVNKKWALLIHVPLGKNEVTLVWVDIERCYEAVKAGIAVKNARAMKGLSTVAMVITGPTLAEKVEAAASKEEINMLYKLNKAAWDDEIKAIVERKRQEWDG